MADLIITERSNIVAIADVIRGKTGQTNRLNLGEIAEGANSIGSGGGGSTTTVTQATPTITVSSSGLITASATQTAGYVNAGTKSATKQLTTQSA